MNAGAARACRADRRFFATTKGHELTSDKVPRDVKRMWKGLSSKERGKLRRQWRLSQFLRGVEGQQRHQRHLEALKAFVKTEDLKL